MAALVPIVDDALGALVAGRRSAIASRTARARRCRHRRAGARSQASRRDGRSRRAAGRRRARSLATFLERLPLRWLVDVGGLDPDRGRAVRPSRAARSRRARRARRRPTCSPASDASGCTAQQMAAGVRRPAGGHRGSAARTGDGAPLRVAGAPARRGRVRRQAPRRAARRCARRGRGGCARSSRSPPRPSTASSCTRLWSRSTGLNVAAMVERIRWQLDGWARAGERRRDQPRAASRRRGHRRHHPAADRAARGARRRRQQLGLWGGRTQADEWAQRATARVIGLVGDEQVVVPAWRGGRQPDDAYRGCRRRSCDLADPSVAPRARRRRDAVARSAALRRHRRSCIPSPVARRSPTPPVRRSPSAAAVRSAAPAWSAGRRAVDASGHRMGGTVAARGAVVGRAHASAGWPASSCSPSRAAPTSRRSSAASGGSSPSTR